MSAPLDGIAQEKRDLALMPVRRWTPARKFGVVLALRCKTVTVAEVIAAHRLSPDEVIDWIAAVDRAGKDGLRVRRSRGDAA